MISLWRVPKLQRDTGYSQMDAFAPSVSGKTENDFQMFPFDKVTDTAVQAVFNKSQQRCLSSGDEILTEQKHSGGKHIL